MDDTMILQSPKTHEPPLIEFRNVVKSYGSKRVLDEICFSIGRGGIIGLLGPNACGKSTIIKLICGLLVPNKGEILINGEPPSYKTAAQISYLPDKNALPSGVSVNYLMDYYGDFFADFDREKAIDMLGRLAIDPKNRVRTLSKGTCEKVQLILAMSRNAQLYVLDEPLGGVDPAAREYILETILKSYNRNSSVLITTHLVRDVESVLDDVIFVDGGKAALCASVAALKNQHGKSVDEIFREVYRC